MTENHSESKIQGIQHLSEQVQMLKNEVKQLSARLSVLESKRPVKQTSGQKQAPSVVLQTHIQDAPPSLIDTKALLPRIATICFLLVVALILRTITDSQVVNTQVGSILGMTYAAILILSGWRLYAKKSRLAPVFPGCGILLLFSVILETHARYESLSTMGAYILLFLAGATVFAMSIRYRASVLICFGVPGTVAVAMAIDFPYPVFPVLGILLLSAILAASYAFKLQMCRYLRWITLVLAAVFWLLWASKMNTLPSCAEPVAEMMYPSWFFPMLFAFWGVFLATVVLNVLKKDLQLGFFESILPTITAIGAFGAGYISLTSWFEKEMWYYLTLVVIATLHLAFAWWLAQRDKEKATGANIFILAGACLIVMTSSVIFKTIGYVLPVWSASALVLTVLSHRWKNEGIRITSYFLQFTACMTAISSGTILVPTSVPLATGIASLGLCLFSLEQYNWSRSNPPDPTHSFFFAKLDKKDYSAVVLLLTGLICGYYLSQFALYEILRKMTTDFAFQFQSGQSLIINTGAILLMYLAMKERNREIILVATIVAFIGAGKVFIFDLLGIKGVPLVLSVFSTGVVAAFGSVVMGRWQRKETKAA